MNSSSLSQYYFDQNSFDTINGHKINVINMKLTSNKEMRAFLKRKAGIYFWINLLDNKIYIGSAVCLWRRFLSYYNSFTKENRRNNIKLKYAIKKYGLTYFRFGVIKILNNDKKLLRVEEQSILDSILPFGSIGYNISKSAFRPLHCPISKRGRLAIKMRHTGENSEMSKLTNEQVIIIKQSLAKGDYLRNLSDKFGVSTTVISNIKRGLSWSHIRCDDEVENILKNQSLRDKRKFSEDMIRKIKTDLKNGLRSIDISKKYNLIYSTVHSIKNGHIYSYIN